MTLRHLAAAAGFAASALAGAALLAGPAAADQEPGFYVGVGAGYNQPADSEADGSTFNLDVDYEGDLGAVLGTLGYKFDGPLRAELEAGRRWNDVESVGAAAVEGDVEATSLMANLLYDFHGLADGVTPYVGAGLGLVHVKVDEVSSVNGSLSNSSDNVLAGQLIAGAAFDVMEDVQVTGQYNLLAARDAGLNNRAGQSYDLDYTTHTVTLGLRFAFPAPEPAPKAEPEPEPEPEPVAEAEPEEEAEPAPEPDTSLVRNFLVFFDWDDATVTGEGREVLRQAVSYAEQGEIVRIQLTGHADTSGPQSYNMGLSQRRADAVRSALVDLGFDGEITTTARGEEEPLVATGDGVREPQNRRVEIVLQP